MGVVSNGVGMYYLRVLLVGFGFCLFGLIGVLGNVIFIPIVLLHLQRHRGIQFFARDLVRWSWFLYLQVLRLTGVISYESRFTYHDSKGQIIVANHPSLLDVVFLLAYIPRANCVLKEGLQRNIFLRFAIRACGYIANSSTENFLNQSIKVLHNQENLIVFPEGTRTKTQIYFHKAVSYLAIHGAKSIKMLYIDARQDALRKEQSWYNVPARRLAYKIYDLGEQNLLNFEAGKTSPMRVRALHCLLNKIYQTQQKERNGAAKYD